jgi:hypothetical protein
MTIAWQIAWSIIQKYWKPILGALIIFGAEMVGEHRVQVKWNAESARLTVIAQQAKDQDTAARKSIEAQHKKDIEYAKSEAGKSAVREYLRTHGLLSTCVPVPSAGSGQAQSPGVPSDGQDPKPGARIDIQEFATECAKGALMNIEWREWALKEDLKPD